MLKALEYLHSRTPPVIHRDIKPSNLMIVDDALILVDFGIAKGGDLLSSSIKAGTMAYAPPEQITGQATDIRSDLFSAGATLYHILTGKLPANAMSREAVVNYDYPDPLKPPHTINPEVPTILSDALMQALSLDPEQRPASAKELHAQFKTAAQLITTPLPSDSLDVIAKEQKSLETQPISTILPTEKAAEGPTKHLADRATIVLPDANADQAPVTAKQKRGLRPWHWLVLGLVLLPTLALLILLLGSKPPQINQYTTLVPLPAQLSRIPIFQAHTDEINALAWNSDGEILASASLDHSIHLWNKEGISLTTLIGHTEGVIAIAWSPDNNILASGAGDNTVRLWKRDGSPIATLEGHTNWVVAVAWSPDGKTLASGSADGTVRLWKADGTPITTLQGHTDGVNAIAWNPNGQILASASSDNSVRLWNANGSPITTLQGHTNRVNIVAWSPNGDILASGSSDGSIRLWKVDGSSLATLEGHSDWINDLAWNRDNNLLASASVDRTIGIAQARIWRFYKGIAVKLPQSRGVLMATS